MEEKETKSFNEGKDGLRYAGILLVGILNLSGVLKEGWKDFKN
jgi:hypothetical protein